MRQRLTLTGPERGTQLAVGPVAARPSWTEPLPVADTEPELAALRPEGPVAMVRLWAAPFTT
jgi:hypothetical protein